jgi:DNA modification methylase
MIIHGDCLAVMSRMSDQGRRFECVFADPPDNIGLNYAGNCNDNRSNYYQWLWDVIRASMDLAPIVWLSYNAIHDLTLKAILHQRLAERINRGDYQIKTFIQSFTFGQHNQRDCGNNFRPLLRIKQRHAPLYPNNIRVPSWRQLNGDSRADPRGRVPGDVWEFPRVTGNSSQRRRWHPTQLNQGLVERAVLLSTRKGGTGVLDPFGGTGTTLRACRAVGRECILIEQSIEYCRHMAQEFHIRISRNYGERSQRL